MIVQAPPVWRQRIQSALKQTGKVFHFDLREFLIPDETHPLRREALQAEQALALSTEASHRWGLPGYAMVCMESKHGISIIRAVHHETRTELQQWDCKTEAQAMRFLMESTEGWKEPVVTSRGDRLRSRFVIDRQDVLTESPVPGRLWLLNESGRFVSSETHDAGGILSGSFNPLHVGHRKMRAAAEELLGQSVVYEMTLKNADKPPLDWLTLSLRSRQFSAGELLLTRVPTFSEKAELFPGATFVIGWDTAVRVLERRFYPEGELESSLEVIAEREGRFLVAARRDEHRLRTLDELTIPARFRDLFSAIPPELFEEEISSTAIREAWLRGESETGPPGLFSTGMIDS